MIVKFVVWNLEILKPFVCFGNKKTFAGVGLAHGTTMRKSRRMMTCKVGSVEVGAGVEGQTRCDFLLKTTFQLQKVPKVIISYNIWPGH